MKRFKTIVFIIIFLYNIYLINIKSKGLRNMEITIRNAKKILTKYLQGKNQKKFEHSIRVARTSKMIAEKCNVSVEDSIIAGLLHDIGKGLSRWQILELANRNNIDIYDFELFETHEALHGKISALLFEEEFDNTEIERFKNISHAISYHVAGGEDKMTPLDKILYIADNAEPEKNIEFYQQLSNEDTIDMNKWVKKIIKDKQSRAVQKQRIQNPLIDATLENLDDER